MYCKYCGRLNDKDAIFCKECGKPFEEQEDQKINEDKKDKTKRQHNKTKTKTKNKTRNKTKNKTKKEKPRKNKYQKSEKGMTFGQKILMFLMFIMIIGLAGIIAFAGYKYYKMEQIKVPDLVNMTYQQAELTLAKKDLKVKKVEQETENQNEENIVLKQNKEPGKKVRKNTTIKIYVGKYVKKNKTEDYTGKNINEVMSILDSNNIKYEIKYKDTEEYQNYTVISQTPKEGKNLKADDVIILTVAKNQTNETNSNTNKEETNQEDTQNNIDTNSEDQ